MQEVYEKNQNAIFITQHKATAAMVQAAIEHHFADKNPQGQLYHGKLKDPEREKVIEWFKEKKITPHPKSLGLMIKSGGVALNLAEADKVIVLAISWNDSVENQAIARAIRAGNVGIKEVLHMNFYSYFTKHKNAIREVKRRIEEFFCNPTISVEEEFKVWLKLIESPKDDRTKPIVNEPSFAR